jgi:hypothetical protein
MTREEFESMDVPQVIMIMYNHESNTTDSQVFAGDDAYEKALKARDTVIGLYPFVSVVFLDNDAAAYVLTDKSLEGLEGEMPGFEFYEIEDEDEPYDDNDSEPYFN